MWKHSFAAAIISLTVSIPFSYAQETQTGAVTGSGQVVQATAKDMFNFIHALMPMKQPKKLKDVIVPDAKEKAWLNESALTLKRQAELRAECREAIRRANRDELMVRARQCYRSDLLLDVGLQRKRIQYLAAHPQITPATLATASGAMTKLIDAEMSIIDAIDTGIFTNMDQLLETKRNLAATYKTPAWLTLTMFRADHEFTWLVFMVNKLEERSDFGDDSSGNADSLHSIALCLQGAATTLAQAMGSTNQQTAILNLVTAQNQLGTCRHTIRDLAKRDRSEVSQKTDNDSSQQ